MAVIYDKRLKQNNAVKSASATTYANQKANSYDSRIANQGLYDGNNAYSRMLDSTMDSLLNRRENYDIASTKALQQYANDYAVMSGLAAQDTGSTVHQLGAGYQTGWQNAVAGQTVQNAAINQNAYDLDKQGIVAQINADNLNARLTGANNAIAMDANKYDRYRTTMNALQQGRSLWGEAYNKFSGMDVDRYATNKNAYVNMQTKKDEAEYAQADRALIQAQADQDYEINRYKQNAEKAREKFIKYAKDGKNESGKKYLQKLVEQGKITQHQADTIFNENNSYLQVAEQKCKKFYKNKNNKGLKSYLKEQLKKGHITKLEYNDLLDAYTYTAPRRSSGSRGSGGSGSGGSGSGGSGGLPSLPTGDDEVKYVGNKLYGQSTIEKELKNRYYIPAETNVFQRTRNPVTNEIKGRVVYSDKQLQNIIDGYVKNGKISRVQGNALFEELRGNSYKG